MSETESFDMFNSFRTFTIKKIIWGRSYKIKYVFFKDENAVRISKSGIYVIPFNDTDGKKIIFQNVILCLNKGNIAHSSSSI